uniref:Secreted protein n=1 Tax=Haemonchus contortus TaxID=6289 RepID=A0A7I4YSF8_HAECO|nr:Protein F45D3.4, isoform a [Haemonchus contortus]
MLLFILFITTAVCVAMPKSRERPDATPTAETKSIEAIRDGSFFTYNKDPTIISPIQLDSIAATMPKKNEKLPLQKPYQFLGGDDRPIPDVLPKSGEFEFLESPPGVAPKMTGSVAASYPNFEFFDFGENSRPSAAAVNPAATFLEGGNFDKIAAPSCQMTGCTGPVPNDGSFGVAPSSENGKTCHQAFVPMNGCTSNRGYPMGMLCTICCDCTASFVAEMKKTHGFKMNFSAS